MNEMVYMGTPESEEIMVNDMKGKLLNFMHEVLCQDAITVECAGQIVDMIKDLAETARNCREAEYYDAVTRAMYEYEGAYPEYDQYGRMGYDGWRYANGEFAPKGHGHRGYHPSMDGRYDARMMMGYSRSGMGNRSQSGSMRSGYMMDEDMMSPYGSSYEGYRRARRNYSTSHSQADKKEMDEYANQHIMHSVESIRDLIDSGDPDLKKKAMNELTKLINEMNS